MRKFFVCFGVLLLAICLFGCENATEIEAGFISSLSSPSSEVQAVKITFSDDSRLEGKGVDCQLRFLKAGQITLWLDGQEKVDYEIQQYDYWYSLTEILAQAKGEKLEFESFDNAISKTILFQSQQEQEVSIRVVAGQREMNFENDGEILVGTEPISNQFRLKLGKK